MTFEELHSQLNLCQEIFCASVRDSFGQSIKETVFDACSNDLEQLQEISDQSDAEKRIIDAMLLELRVIVI